MGNIITLVGCSIVSFMLLISIFLAGPHLTFPATFMIFTVLVGGLCIYVINGIFKKRAEIMKTWDD